MSSPDLVSDQGAPYQIERVITMPDKVEVNVTMHRKQLEWLQEMAKKHHLPDQDKALRVLLDFAVEDGDEAVIFEQMRCRHCG